MRAVILFYMHACKWGIFFFMRRCIILRRRFGRYAHGHIARCPPDYSSGSTIAAGVRRVCGVLGTPNTYTSLLHRANQNDWWRADSPRVVNQRRAPVRAVWAAKMGLQSMQLPAVHVTNLQLSLDDEIDIFHNPHNECSQESSFECMWNTLVPLFAFSNEGTCSSNFCPRVWASAHIYLQSS